MARLKPRSGGLEGTRLRFEDVSYECLVLSVEGHEGSGKSSMALAAPGPIAYFHTSDGVDRAIKRFRELYPDKRVAFAGYTWTRPEKYNQKTWKELKKKLVGDAWYKHWEDLATEAREGAYEPFVNDWDAAVTSGDFRTLVQDVATDVWELFKLAHFGKLTENAQLNYGPVNASYVRTIKSARDAGCNVVLVHQVTQAYKNVIDDRTGREKSVAIEGVFRRKGMNQIGYLVDSYVETQYVEAPAVKGRKRGEDEFKVRIIKCKDEMTLNGQVLPTMEFGELAQLLKPRVDPSRWE